MKRIIRYRVLPIVLATLVMTAVLVTASYVLRSEDVLNRFSPAEASNPEVNESFDGILKENVSFQVEDMGYPVYVRAAIVVTWQKLVNDKNTTTTDDDEYIVHYLEPKFGEDYEMTLNLLPDVDWETYSLGGEQAPGWVKGPMDLSGRQYYYYTVPVDSGESTEVLLSSCNQLGDPPEEGYTLSVELIVQTVQAVGWTDDTSEDAWKDAWFTSSHPDDEAGDEGGEEGGD